MILERKEESVEKLDVFRKAYALSLEIHRATLQFPKIEHYALGDQLRRSSKSVCANLAEGFARQRESKAEFKRFVVIALGSCHESSLWLRYAADLGYIDGAAAQAWQDQHTEVARMLGSLLNYLSNV